MVSLMIITKIPLKHRLRALLVGCLLLPGFLLYAQSPRDTLKVLFVGNSYTYYQNLPHIVSLISDSTSIKLDTYKSTAGGVNLSQHWNGEKDLRTKEIIRNGNFDIVVLQDHSWGPIKESQQFQEYGELFCDLIKQSGAKPYLYLTWARSKVPQYQEKLTAEYSSLALQHGAEIIPVGTAWAQARKLQPMLNLYTEDGSHPNDLGTYLAACVFVGVICGEYPSKLPLRYYTKDHKGESVELLRMKELDIEFLMQVAKSVVQP